MGSLRIKHNIPSVELPQLEDHRLNEEVNAKTNSERLDRICEGLNHFLNRAADSSRLCLLKNSL